MEFKTKIRGNHAFLGDIIHFYQCNFSFFAPLLIYQKRVSARDADHSDRNVTKNYFWATILPVSATKREKIKYVLREANSNNDLSLGTV